MFLFKFLVLSSLILYVLSLSSPKNINPLSCSSSQYYNYIKFICYDCPSNQAPSSLTFCSCNSGYHKDPSFIGFQSNNTCLANTGSNIFLLNNRDGSANNTSQNCSTSVAYPNADKTSCFPCPQNMIINSTTKVC